MDKHAQTALWNLKAQQLIHCVTKASKKKKKRTLDCHRFLSTLQHAGGNNYSILEQFKPLVDEVGEITTTLDPDMYIQHMCNKKVQEKEPDQALELAF